MHPLPSRALYASSLQRPYIVLPSSAGLATPQQPAVETSEDASQEASGSSQGVFLAIDSELFGVWGPAIFFKDWSVYCIS